MVPTETSHAAQFRRWLLATAGVLVSLLLAGCAIDSGLGSIRGQQITLNLTDGLDDHEVADYQDIVGYWRIERTVTIIMDPLADYEEEWDELAWIELNYGDPQVFRQKIILQMTRSGGIRNTIRLGNLRIPDAAARAYTLSRQITRGG